MDNMNNILESYTEAIVELRNLFSAIAEERGISAKEVDEKFAALIAELGKLSGAPIQVKAPEPVEARPIADAPELEVAEPVAGKPVEPAPVPKVPPEPPKKEPETEEEKMLAEFAGISEMIRARSLPVDPRLLAVLDKAPSIFGDLSPEDRSGDKGLKLFVDSLMYLEKLRDSAMDKQLREASDNQAAKFSEYLKTKGFEFFPADCAPPANIDETRYETQKEYSDKPAGAAVRLVCTGIEYKGKAVRKAKVAVSAGPAPEVYKLLMEMRSAAMNRASDPKLRPLALRAADEIAKLAAMVPEKKSEMHPDYVRMALSHLDEVNENEALSGIIRKVLAYLKKEGYSEMMVVVGDKFDESYPDTKYERRLIPSNESKFKIIKLIRRGFLDKNGVTVQKAVVGVSAG